ncbi:c-type cytochrome [Candidimonas humi]|jgi:cytochrome c|uniref:C-type cytochrome n=1 Tax=Candidimonas humi TaxID=683355 RepID=A0ABV8P2I7_9BURK|nr:c-type cytochrome [Candidimonas humi]
MNHRTLKRSILAGMALCAASSMALAQDAAPDAAQIQRGKQAFQVCLACHSVTKGQQGIGPSLAGIYGTKAGEVAGYRFSGPMKRSGLTWDAATLDKFIANPQAVVPGTRMPFSGMPDANERKDLIAYLSTLK